MFSAYNKDWTVSYCQPVRKIGLSVTDAEGVSEMFESFPNEIVTLCLLKMYPGLMLVVIMTGVKHWEADTSTEVHLRYNSGTLHQCPCADSGVRWQPCLKRPHYG